MIVWIRGLSTLLLVVSVVLIISSCQNTELIQKNQQLRSQVEELQLNNTRLSERLSVYVNHSVQSTLDEQQRSRALYQRLQSITSERSRIEHYLESKYLLSPNKAKVLAGYFYDAKSRAEEKYGIDLDISVLVALTHTESTFRVDVTSSAGAIGIMQVMPNYHLDRYDFLESREDLFVPKLNIRTGVFIFAEGLSRYGDVRKAIRAYHGGHGGVTDPKPSTKQYEKKIMETFRKLEV